MLGLGRAGRALLAEYRLAGLRVVGAWNRTDRSFSMPDDVPLVFGGDAGEALLGWAPDVVLLCVSDDALADVLEGLHVPPGTVLLHTSGSLPLSALPARPDLHLGGWHPLQSFGATSDGRAPVPAYCVALDGDDRAIEIGRSLAAATGHPSVVVRGPAKAAYHAAAVLASNAFVALEAAAVRVMETAGVAPEDCWALLKPLVHGTLENLSEGGFRAAITGPVARGDADTVARNMEAIRGVPGASEIYRALGLEALAVAGPDLTSDEADRVRAALMKI